MKKILLLVFSLFFLNSCIIDYKPAGYFVYNHTKDTLLIEMTESETLTDSIYWGIHSLDSVFVRFGTGYDMCVCKRGKSSFLAI